MVKKDSARIERAEDGSGETPGVNEKQQVAGAAINVAPDKYTGADVRRDPSEDYGGISVVETTDEPSPAASGVNADVSGSLTAAERAELESILSPAQIEAIEAGRRSRVERRGKAKRNLPQLIAEHAEEMIMEAKNKRLHSAKRVGEWLISHGLHETVRGFNAFGDALGGHGLKLPYVNVKGRRYYDLACIGWTQEQKDMRQATLNEMGADVRLSIIAD